MKQLPTPPYQARLDQRIENTRWTPLYLTERRRGETYWMMRCVCGEEKEVAYKNYVTGRSLSCGCYRRELWASEASRRGRNRLPVGEAARNQLLLIYRRGAQKKGRAFELTREQFLSLTSSDCHYCGHPPHQIMNSSKYRADGRGVNGAYIYNGVDRVDSDGVYTMSNCVSCCRMCNYAKRDMLYGDFIAWLDAAARFRSKQIQEAA